MPTTIYFPSLSIHIEKAIQQAPYLHRSYLHTTDDWLMANGMVVKKLVVAVILDFSAAFDAIDHTLQATVLWFYFQCNFWVQSSIREKTVFFNGSFSHCNVANCGIPQGSRLGPLLYSIFTNNLPLCVNMSTKLCMLIIALRTVPPYRHITSCNSQ